MPAWDHSNLTPTPYRNAEGLRVLIASGETGDGRKFWFETSEIKEIAGCRFRCDVYKVKWFEFEQARQALNAKYKPTPPEGV